MSHGIKVLIRRLLDLGLIVLMWSFMMAIPPIAAQEYKTYVSQQNGFSFQYPATYEVSGARDYLDFRQDGKTKFLVWVDDHFIQGLYQMLYPGPVIYYRGQEDPYRKLAATTSKDKELFHRYARQVAQNWCSADGPDGSVYCNDFQSEKAFTSHSGFDCLEFYLNIIREDFVSNTKEHRVAGPVMAVYLPKMDLPVVLMISPIYGQSASLALVHEMQGIIDSLKMAP